MNKSNLKYYIGIITILIVDSLHILFFDNNSKIDVYIFYNHERYLTNILYDISNLLKFSILTFWLIRLNRKIFTPLFIWLSYFTFYNQKSSMFIIPLYIGTVLMYNKKLFKK